MMMEETVKDLIGAHERRRASIQCHMLLQYQKLDVQYQKVIDFLIEGLQNNTIDPTLDIGKLLTRYEEQQLSGSTIQGQL